MCTVLQYTGTGAGPFEFSIFADSRAGTCAVAGAGVSASAHCNENPIYEFPEKELRLLSPYFHIHVSVSDFCIACHDRSAYSATGKYVDFLWTDPGNI
jgi:hypothetical protein